MNTRRKPHIRLHYTPDVPVAWMHANRPDTGPWWCEPFTPNSGRFWTWRCATSQQAVGFAIFLLGL